MAKKIKTPLPPHLDLGGNWVIEWDAVDPTTGNTVAGVVISDTSLLIAQTAGPPISDSADNPILLAVSGQ